MSDQDKKLQPQFPVVKDTLEGFVKQLNTIVDGKKNGTRLKDFSKMIELRDSARSLLQSYSQQENQDPVTAETHEKLDEPLTKLATPQKRLVKATLAQINGMIQNIENEYQYCKIKPKAKRVKELKRHRKKVCCRFSKYPQSPKQSKCCLRFKPCSTKVVPMYGVRVKSKTNNRGIKIKSRMLEIDFDDETDNLSLPSYWKIRACLDFYSRLIDRLNHQVSHKQSVEEKKKLEADLEASTKRHKFLDGMKAEIECRRKIKPQDVKAVNEEDKQTDVLGIFTSQKFESFRPFTNFIELPSRQKLETALMFHKQLLADLNKKRQSKSHSLLSQWDINISTNRTFFHSENDWKSGNTKKG